MVAENSTDNQWKFFSILEHITLGRGKLKFATIVKLASNCVITGGHKRVQNYQHTKSTPSVQRLEETITDDCCVRVIHFDRIKRNFTDKMNELGHSHVQINIIFNL